MMPVKYIDVKEPCWCKMAEDVRNSYQSFFFFAEVLQDICFRFCVKKAYGEALNDWQHVNCLYWQDSKATFGMGSLIAGSDRNDFTDRDSISGDTIRIQSIENKLNSKNNYINKGEFIM